MEVLLDASKEADLEANTENTKYILCIVTRMQQYYSLICNKS